MAGPPRTTPLRQQRLESWKEVAGYLNRDIRTVQRWERGKGLPVRRLPGGEKAAVYALQSELDAWWSSRGIHLLEGPAEAPAAAPARRPRYLLWAAAALVAVVAAGLYWLTQGRMTPPPLRVVPLTSYDGHVDYPSFSPDAKKVVFTWDGPKQDNYDLYVKRIGEGEPRRLTADPAVDSWARWSPDGRRIGFARWQPGSPTYRLVIVPAEGGLERMVADAPVTEVWPVPGADWTPDSRRLITGVPAPPAPSSLFLFSVETGDSRRLTSPPAGWTGDDSPVLSPDGRRLAFIRRSSVDAGNVFLLDLTADFTPRGEPRQVTSERCCVANPMWTGDGQEILYVMHEQDGTTLYRIPARPGAKPQPVPSVGPLGLRLAISPQGDKLAYVTGVTDSDLWRADLPRGGRRPAEPLEGVRSSSRIGLRPVTT